MFFDEKHSKSTEFHYLETDFYRAVMGFVDAMNTLNQEIYNHSGSCRTVKQSRRTRKI